MARAPGMLAFLGLAAALAAPARALRDCLLTTVAEEADAQPGIHPAPAAAAP